uniref:Uncharacterized protein n=1 Tax=Picea glauca TaxID=3330 RepID=A0A101LTQ0_PICGL|nr:hypothetical protein ABT39_MTgene3604 [Picea glauca]
MRGHFSGRSRFGKFRTETSRIHFEASNSLFLWTGRLLRSKIPCSTLPGLSNGASSASIGVHMRKLCLPQVGLPC